MCISCIPKYGFFFLQNMLDDSVENVASKIDNQEEYHEQMTNDNEERSCLASECIFTR